MAPAALLLLAMATLAAPAARTQAMRLDASTTVEVRYYTEDPDPPLPVRVRVLAGARTLGEFTLRGRPNWVPWGLHATRPLPQAGAGRPGLLIETLCNHGGSGTAVYLSLVTREGDTARLTEICSTSEENIHSGEFLVARTPAGVGFVATEPVMDGPSRADATHWRVRCYLVRGGRSAAVSSRTTPQPYSEQLPRRAIPPLLPVGWRLTGG